MPFDQVVIGDCVTLLNEIPSETVDLVFADPPFNIGYEYDRYNDRRTHEDYLNWTTEWLTAAVRVLKPSGSMFVAIGDEYVAEHKVRLDALQMTMRNWIVWHYTFGVSCTHKFSRSHTHILYYVKDAKRFTFNSDAIRVPSARQTTYADRRANQKGKVPDNTWVLRPQEDERFFQPDTDTWNSSRVCGTFHERLSHPCQMPEAILDRILRVSSDPGDLVLDPFAGSGTTLAVAKKLDRRYYGIELSPDYAQAIEERLDAIDQPATGCASSVSAAVPSSPSKSSAV